jgi:hypothetical protein
MSVLFKRGRALRCNRSSAAHRIFRFLPAPSIRLLPALPPRWMEPGGIRETCMACAETTCVATRRRRPRFNLRMSTWTCDGISSRTVLVTGRCPIPASRAAPASERKSPDQPPPARAHSSSTPVSMPAARAPRELLRDHRNEGCGVDFFLLLGRRRRGRLSVRAECERAISATSFARLHDAIGNNLCRWTGQSRVS